MASSYGVPIRNTGHIHKLLLKHTGTKRSSRTEFLSLWSEWQSFICLQSPVGIFMGASARPSSAELLHLLGNTKPAWLPVGVKPVCSIFKYTKVSSKVSVWNTTHCTCTNMYRIFRKNSYNLCLAEYSPSGLCKICAVRTLAILTLL